MSDISELVHRWPRSAELPRSSHLLIQGRSHAIVEPNGHQRSRRGRLRNRRLVRRRRRVNRGQGGTRGVRPRKRRALAEYRGRGWVSGAGPRQRRRRDDDTIANGRRRRYFDLFADRRKRLNYGDGTGTFLRISGERKMERVMDRLLSDRLSGRWTHSVSDFGVDELLGNFFPDGGQFPLSSGWECLGGKRERLGRKRGSFEWYNSRIWRRIGRCGREETRYERIRIVLRSASWTERQSFGGDIERRGRRSDVRLNDRGIF